MVLKVLYWSVLWRKSNNPGYKRSVVILWDSGTSQSLILKVLLTFEETEEGTNALITGLTEGHIVAPL